MSPPTSYERRWLILALIAIAQLMIVLDLTIVNIALPSAQQDLGFSNDERQWVITAYALAFGSLLLPGGKVGDLFGRKWAFIGGLFGFAGASAVGGAAGSFGVLVAARGAQGVFAALLAPSALALLAITFSDPDERGKAFGIYGAVAGGGSAVGLLLGGILTEWLDLALVPVCESADRRAHRDRRAAVDRGTSRAARPAADRPPRHAHSSRRGCSRSSTASRTPRSTPGAHPVTIVALALAVVLLLRVRVRRVARRAPAAAAARGHRPRAGRLLSGARDLGHRPVRGVPVPDLLPATDARACRRSRPALPTCR